MKAKELWPMAHRYVRDFVGAEEAVESLLLQFGYCRGALVQYGEGRSVNDESNNSDALLFAKAEEVFPIVLRVEVVQVNEMQQPKCIQQLANAIVNDSSE
jgi:hypothetical protein